MAALFGSSVFLIIWWRLFVWATHDKCCVKLVLPVCDFLIYLERWSVYLHIITCITYIGCRGQKYFVLLSCNRYILPICITYIEVQTISPPIHTCLWITQVSLTFRCPHLLTFYKYLEKCGKQWSMKQHRQYALFHLTWSERSGFKLYQPIILFSQFL